MSSRHSRAPSAANVNPENPPVVAEEKADSALSRDQQIRLECLSLVYHPNKDEPFLIARAAKFEEYVRNGQPREASQEALPGRQDEPDVPA